MSSVTKTLQLLAFFSPSRPEIGLSQLCRLAKRDKATTYRHLQALEEAGFVEQNTVTKCYRLGPALLQLAQTRETTVPRKLGAQAPLHALAEATGETAHATVLSGTTLYSLTSCESPAHSIRAIIDIETFPLHATASGLCALGFGPEDLIEVATSALQSFTNNTLTTPDHLLSAVDSVRSSGFSVGNRTYEDEVLGIAAPLFDQTGQFAGAVSVATVATRFTPELERKIQHQLIQASRDISRNWGGKIPGFVEAAWAKSLSHSNALETAS